MQSGLAWAQSPWKAGRGPHAHVSDEEAGGGWAAAWPLEQDAVAAPHLSGCAPLGHLASSCPHLHAGREELTHERTYLACSSRGCPGDKFRVVPGAPLRVHHRVTEGSLRWRQKQETAGDPSPGSHLTQTALGTRAPRE